MNFRGLPTIPGWMHRIHGLSMRIFHYYRIGLTNSLLAMNLQASYIGLHVSPNTSLGKESKELAYLPIIARNVWKSWFSHDFHKAISPGS